MTIRAERLAELLEQINGGQAKKALPSIEKWLEKHPGHAALLGLKAEALRLMGRIAEAIEAFKAAGQVGTSPRNWLVAGILLAGERNTDESVACLRKALAMAPDNDEVLDVLVTTYFNASRYSEGIEFARRQLELSRNPRFLSNAALLLQSNDLYEESTQAFRKIIALTGDDPAFVGAALVPSRFTCDWAWIESLQARMSALYARGEFAAPQEYPLTHVTWCANEAYNFGVTQAYAKRMVPTVKPLATRAQNPKGRRLRVGYLSCDFRNHATMHLLAGLFECHDRERFEVFAYDYSNPDVSEYRDRFLNAVEHHVEIHTLKDDQAAQRIAEDKLDILFDLKGYTGGGRSPIMAYRAAPLQVAFLGYPGSTAMDCIDYIVSDRFVTPDSSTPYYTEKFCRMPHSYQSNDRKRQRPQEVRGRAAHGLPLDKVVFGAFNQSYKIDRTSFDVWMRILREVPDSVLWLLGQNDAAIGHLQRHASLAGVDPQRLIFAPFLMPQEHLARLQLADAALDTLVCNGHTTTSDALWAGVPVITAHGTHFSSRVSESLLNALDMAELVGQDHADMVRIAQRIGTDAAYRQQVRQAVERNRLSAPLFDTARYTRNFERAIELMTQAYRQGKTRAHIDVPDCGIASEPMPAAPAPILVPAAAPASAPVPAPAPAPVEAASLDPLVQPAEAAPATVHATALSHPRYAIITPYRDEPREMLERCMLSVGAQTLPVDHILVGDGGLQEWIVRSGVRHIHLDRAHDDSGNLARAVGAMMAIAEQYDGIGFLNPQDWLEPNHAEVCVQTYQAAASAGSPVDFVIARRTLRRVDESILLQWHETPETHVDNNCFFFFPTSYPLVPHFGLIPQPLSAIGDRFFFKALRERGMRSATNSVFTVNDLCLWRSLYEALGETPPADAKPNIDDAAVQAWLTGLNPAQRQLVDRLTGSLP
jgi:predicted O-linked N-acetylglucosamine transferase (SPINDLY family)